MPVLTRPGEKSTRASQIIQFDKRLKSTILGAVKAVFHNMLCCSGQGTRFTSGVPNVLPALKKRRSGASLVGRARQTDFKKQGPASDRNTHDEEARPYRFAFAQGW